MAVKRQAAAGPPPPPPPPPAQTSKGERGVFNTFINAHKALAPYAGQIWTWANNYGGITPTQLASVLWLESKGDPAAVSSAGAKGLAQIFDATAGAANDAGVPFFRGDRTITDADKANPAFAIQYAAWRLSGAVQKYGSIDQAWEQGYNPGYKPGVDGPANPVSQYLPKGYVGTPAQTSGQSSTRTVGTEATTASIKAQILDRWAVLGTDGKVKFVKITDPAAPPSNVLEYGPTPLTQTSFIQTWKQTYADTFFAYTGHQASGKQIANILKNAPSVYTLANTLATTPAFASSPTYKAHAPGIVAIVKDQLGQDAKVDKGFVAKAIAENWDQATLAANIRNLPAFVNGPVFKDTVAKMSNVYQGIYGKGGNPDVAALVADVAKKGWTQDEFAAYLRQQPEYGSSEEAKSRALAFATQIGLIAGQMPTLTADQAMLGGPPGLPPTPKTTAPAAPADTRPVIQPMPPGAQPTIRGEAKNEAPFTRKVKVGY